MWRVANGLDNADLQYKIIVGKLSSRFLVVVNSGLAQHILKST